MKLIMSERLGSDTLQGSIDCPDLPYVSGFALFFKKNHETNSLGTHFNDIIIFVESEKTIAYQRMNMFRKLHL